ncbi:hypothetical protein BaRGS_00039386 [Batillaria attramentaria]|uniref:Uncharacterized protein n=1 Tax=Batillaria attramentaria TaxID=370345 RepID=A0ABD0J3I2_9CAEN
MVFCLHLLRTGQQTASLRRGGSSTLETTPISAPGKVYLRPVLYTPAGEEPTSSKLSYWPMFPNAHHISAPAYSVNTDPCRKLARPPLFTPFLVPLPSCSAQGWPSD